MTNSLGFLRTEDGRSSGAIGWRGELDRNSESDLLSSHSLGYGQHCRSAVPLSLHPLLLPYSLLPPRPNAPIGVLLRP